MGKDLHLHNFLLLMAQECLVIDRGSFNSRIGFASAYRPSKTVKNHEIFQPKGDNCTKITKLLQFSFSELKVSDTSETAILLTHSPLSSQKIKEDTISTIFEKFNIPSLYLGNQSALALYASGKTTGVVLHSGDNNISHSVPIHNGTILNDAITNINIGGNFITDYLSRILLENTMNPNDMERDFLLEIKETLTYVALEFDNEMKKASTCCDIDEVYELPDGRIVLIKNERFRCAEVFFQPKLADLDSPGIHEILNNSILHSDVGIRKDLYDNILLSGGSTKFPGFEDRLTKELLPLLPKERFMHLLIGKFFLGEEDLSWVDFPPIAPILYQGTNLKNLVLPLLLRNVYTYNKIDLIS